MKPGNGNSQAAATALPRHFVAFVLDDQNLVPEHLPLASTAAIRHFSKLLPGDRAAVVATSGRVVVDFTDDPERLRLALSGLGSLDRRATFDVSKFSSEISCKITHLKADWIRNGDSGILRNCVPAAWMQQATRVDRGPSSLGIRAASGADNHRIVLENQVRAFAESIVQAGDRDVQTYFAGSWRTLPPDGWRVHPRGQRPRRRAPPAGFRAGIRLRPRVFAQRRAALRQASHPAGRPESSTRGSRSSRGAAITPRLRTRTRPLASSAKSAISSSPGRSGTSSPSDCRFARRRSRIRLRS